MKPNYTLYLVTDRETLQGRDLLQSIEAAIQGGVTIIQLREKSLTSREFYNQALAIKALTDRYNIPLIINDRLDIALAIDAAGVHLGQQDLPATIARQLLGPTKLLGVSANTLDEAEKAVAHGANYLGVGAMFPTATKQNTRSMTIERLQQIKKSVPIPVVAIGGINEQNLHLLENCSIDGIAVVSAILGKDDPKRAAETMLHLFKSNK